MTSQHPTGLRLVSEPRPLPHFSPDIIREIFPFHVAMDRCLRIVQLGAAIERICGASTVGAPFASHFRIVTPAVPEDFQAIRDQSFTVFFVEHRGRSLTLKGQMLFSDACFPGLVVFLCSPVVRDMAAVTQLGLTLNDFAIHDSAVDFLILIQTKTNTINDVKKMAERLRQEVAVRREAESELKRINEDLEERVRARTAELEQANAELKLWVRRLEQRSRHMALLNKMGDLLQACRTVRETYSVVVDSILQLFPASAGALALADASGERFRVAESWGGLSTDDVRWAQPDCWALKLAEPHVGGSGAQRPVCGHVEPNAEGTYVCVALAAQGETLGLLHLRNVFAGPSAEPGSHSEWESRLQIIHTAAEHIGLAIANIRLQEDLRQQSIRDPLTGLHNRRHMEDALEREAARALRARRSLAIIMLDVDHFKRINDTHGHAAGDQVLRRVGQYLRKHVRGEDVACRYGGEEFILLLPGASLSVAQQRAEQIRTELAQCLAVEGSSAPAEPITVSLGVSEFPAYPGQLGREAVAAADWALYSAKESGRNRVVAATEQQPPEPQLPADGGNQG